MQAPPAKSGSNVLVFIIVGAAAVFALLVVVFAALVFNGFKHAGPRAATDELKARYSSKNELLTLHYPEDFAAKNLDDTTVSLTRNLPGGHDELVLVAAVKKPITDDVNEFGRILLVATSKHVVDGGGSYREVSRQQAKCVGGLPGFQVESEATLSSGTVLQMSTCFAMHGGHGYEFKTAVAKQYAVAELPLLNRILQATELATTP